MNIPTKKLSNGFELPVYGLGTWQMGGLTEASTDNDERDIKAIKDAIDMGVTHIDTAEIYGAGHAEELIGIAIKDYDRSKLFIASKVFPPNQTYEGIYNSFNASVKRLGTDYLDLYMLHKYPDSSINLSDTMRAMDELVDKGLVRNIGVCNMTPERFDEVQKLTRNKLVCNQVHYNVQFREIEKRGVLEHAQNNDTFLVAWRPLQKGLLDSNNPLINSIAEKYNKTPAQIAINWLISQKNVVTISKTSNIVHLKENMGALDFVMDDEDIESIRAEYPDQRFVSDAVPLDY